MYKHSLYRGDKPANWPVRIYIYRLLVKKATLAIPATLANQKALMFQPAAQECVLLLSYSHKQNATWDKAEERSGW